MKRKGTGGQELMSEQIALHNNSFSVAKRLQLLDGHDFSSRGTPRPPITSCSCGPSRVAEVVGGTTAECAAVVCCCPCGVVDLLLLAIYKLPAGLYRKALRKRKRRRMIKNRSAFPHHRQSFEDDDPGTLGMITDTDSDSDKDVMALEEEMWGKFYSSGFWRSSSQKSDESMFIKSAM